MHRLLESILDQEHQTISDMAAGAYTSAAHFSRQVRGRAGESPAAIKRRVVLEQAAWRLQHGASVTDTAFAAGYDSVEGFSRAFRRAYGYPPTSMAPLGERGHWLPAPNGIHFHSPTVLYVESGPGVESGLGMESGLGVDSGGGQERSSGDVLSLQVHHDVADIDALLQAARPLDAPELHQTRLPGSRPRGWDGPDESLTEVLRHLVLSKEPWLASIAGEADPDLTLPDDSIASLSTRHRQVTPRWLALIADIQRRGAWADRIIDALCDPPESFLLSQIVAHELTFSAHRRLLARWMLADAGIDINGPQLDPDPITWHRNHTGGTS